jgi:hypothetical protein
MNKMENMMFIPDYPQFPSEFLSDGDIFKIFNESSLHIGRMISGSKSSYRNRHPDNLVVFNANIVTKSRGKIWHGDLDITIDYEKLKEVAEKIKEDMYILYETDARFEKENAGFPYWENRAVTKIEYHGKNS